MKCGCGEGCWAAGAGVKGCAPPKAGDCVPPATDGANWGGGEKCACGESAGGGLKAGEAKPGLEKRGAGGGLWE